MDFDPAMTAFFGSGGSGCGDLRCAIAHQAASPGSPSDAFTGAWGFVDGDAAALSASAAEGGLTGDEDAGVHLHPVRAARGLWMDDGQALGWACRGVESCIVLPRSRPSSRSACTLAHGPRCRGREGWRDGTGGVRVTGQ
jgi:hypothetical protein